MLRSKTILSCLSVLLVAAGCKEGPDPGTASASGRRPISVKVQDPAQDENICTASYVGTVEPIRTAVISARNSGTLASLSIRQGDRVEKGQVIARMESQNVKSTYEMAHATLDQAEDGYQRASQVYGTGSISEVQMVEVRSKLSQARAAAAAADKALADCTIKSPFDGYVAEVLSDEGVELDMFGPIARIMDISEVEIRFSVPENEVSGINAGQKVTVDVGAIGTEGLSGRVASKGVAASPLSHSYECTVRLDKRCEDLMPGMVCRIRMEKDRASGTIVPASVLQTGMEGRYLWVVRDGKAEKRLVTVGGFAGKGVLITEGLEPGDRIIVEGFQKVSSGMKVNTEQ